MLAAIPATHGKSWDARAYASLCMLHCTELLYVRQAIRRRISSPPLFHRCDATLSNTGLSR